jgi:hypothetical protein
LTPLSISSPAQINSALLHMLLTTALAAPADGHIHARPAVTIAIHSAAFGFCPRSNAYYRHEGRNLHTLKQSLVMLVAGLVFGAIVTLPKSHTDDIAS